MDHTERACYSCSVPIPSSDLEKSRAITVLKKPYCRACSDRIASCGLPRTQRFTRRILLGTMALVGVRDHLGQLRRPLYLVAVILSLGLMALVFVAMAWGWGIRS